MFCSVLNLGVFSGCSGVREASFFPISVPYVQYIKCTLAAQLKQLEISWSRKASEKGAQSVWLQKCRNKSFGWWFYRAETKLLIRLQLCSSVPQACNQISGDKHLCFSRKGHCHVFCSMRTSSGGLGCWCSPTGCWRLLWCAHIPQILENPPRALQASTLQKLSTGWLPPTLRLFTAYSHLFARAQWVGPVAFHSELFHRIIHTNLPWTAKEKIKKNKK